MTRALISTVVSLTVFLAGWTLLLVLFNVPDYLLPTPWALAEKTWFLVTRAGLLGHIPVTLWEILYGFAWGLAVGIAAAFLFVRLPIVEAAVNPVIVFLQTAPKIAIAPLLLLWLGLGITPKVVLVAIVTFFPILTNMLGALRAMPPQYNELARLLHMPLLTRMWRIELPQSLPMLFAGMKVAATLAVTAAVIGELMGAQAGLGYLLSLGQETADVSLALVSVLILSAIGYLLYVVIEWTERRLLYWHESAGTAPLARDAG